MKNAAADNVTEVRWRGDGVGAQALASALRARPSQARRSQADRGMGTTILLTATTPHTTPRPILMCGVRIGAAALTGAGLITAPPTWVARIRTRGKIAG